MAEMWETTKWLLMITGGLTLWLVLVLLIIGLIVVVYIAGADIIQYFKAKARAAKRKEQRRR